MSPQRLGKWQHEAFLIESSVVKSRAVTHGQRHKRGVQIVNRAMLERLKEVSAGNVTRVASFGAPDQQHIERRTRQQSVLCTLLGNGGGIGVGKGRMDNRKDGRWPTMDDCLATDWIGFEIVNLSFVKLNERNSWNGKGRGRGERGT